VGVAGGMAEGGSAGLPASSAGVVIEATAAAVTLRRVG
jgi:hypothetical protein